MHVFDFESGLLTVIALAMLAVKAFALIDAILRPAQAFPAVDKLTKPAWLLILGLALVTGILFPQPIGLFSLVGIIAALVYLVDVRPAVAEVTRR